jgi:outer membrane protein OmpA-like peptidoglycan-associated protein
MKRLSIIPLTAVALILTGCATNRSVEEKIAAAQTETNQKIESVETQVEDLQQRQKTTEVRVDQLSQEAKEALKRAQEAGVLAKGQVVFEQAFSEDRVKFKLNSYELDDTAKTALTEFAGRVKELEPGYFIEIQGHTDSTGASRYNDELGQKRADEVRRYLSREHALPPIRMSTISYGDTMPVDSNKTRDGRSANRRVVVVVMQ